VELKEMWQQEVWVATMLVTKEGGTDEILRIEQMTGKFSLAMLD